MEDELCADFAKRNPLYFLHIDSSLDVGPLHIIDGLVGNEQASLLFFLVIIELKDGTAHNDDFYSNSIRTSVLEFLDNGLFAGEFEQVVFFCQLHPINNKSIPNFNT